MLGASPTADKPMTDRMPPNSEPPAQCRVSCGPWWRLPLLLALVLGAMVLARGVSGPEVVPAPQTPPTAPNQRSGDRADSQPIVKTVALVIDFGDGRTRRYDEMAWHDGMTVGALLAAVRELPGGPTFAQQGSGASALLTAIDGVANEGRAGRNWAFFVNDGLADRGFGAYVLRPGDHVLWSFVPAR
jgi:hypothetical protein